MERKGTTLPFTEGELRNWLSNTALLNSDTWIVSCIEGLTCARRKEGKLREGKKTSAVQWM
jgi:hypothetical protein